MDRTIDRFFVYRSPKRRWRSVYLRGAVSSHTDTCARGQSLGHSVSKRKRGLEKVVSAWSTES